MESMPCIREGLGEQRDLVSTIEIQRQGEVDELCIYDVRKNDNRGRILGFEGLSL